MRCAVCEAHAPPRARRPRRPRARPALARRMHGRSPPVSGSAGSRRRRTRTAKHPTRSQLYGRIGVTPRHLGAARAPERSRSSAAPPRCAPARCCSSSTSRATRTSCRRCSPASASIAANAGSAVVRRRHHIEGGFGLEYRADGGFVVSADFRLGGRSIDDEYEVQPLAGTSRSITRSRRPARASTAAPASRRRHSVLEVELVAERRRRARPEVHVGEDLAHAARGRRRQVRIDHVEKPDRAASRRLRISI